MVNQVYPVLVSGSKSGTTKFAVLLPAVHPPPWTRITCREWSFAGRNMCIQMETDWLLLELDILFNLVAGKVGSCRSGADRARHRSGRGSGARCSGRRARAVAGVGRSAQPRRLAHGRREESRHR